jgi:hypothetical protein
LSIGRLYRGDQQWPCLAEPISLNPPPNSSPNASLICSAIPTRPFRKPRAGHMGPLPC